MLVLEQTTMVEGLSVVVERDLLIENFRNMRFLDVRLMHFVATNFGEIEMIGH
jgi:hypothetical protein